MAILNVTANHDYRLDDLSTITEIHFNGAFTAIFDQSQFGGSGISNSVLISGGPFDENTAVIEVRLTQGGTGFSAAQWEVPSGGGLIRLVGTASAEVITGSDATYAEHEFIGGGGADVLTGGYWDDLFIYAATGDVEPGEKIDGGGWADNTISVRATNDFRGADIVHIDWIEILGAETTATFFNGQLIHPDFFEGVQEYKMRVSGAEDGGTVQTLVVQADSDVPGKDAAATLKYVSLYRWGKEDQIFINGTAGDDYLFGSNKADIFDAGVGKDDLFGRRGKDTLDGGTGKDWLDGGAEKDTLTGGADKDAFVFAAPLKGGKNVDHITDFAPGIDIIKLEREDFVGLGKGKLDKDAFVSGNHVTKAKHAQDRIVYNETIGALYFDKDGKGGAKAVKFAVLDGAPHLEAGDIIVFA